jgi:hypothetical protein
VSQKGLQWRFLKISALLDFVKLIFKNSKNLLETTNKEAILKKTIPMKNSSKILNRRNVEKINFFLFICHFRGGGGYKISSLQKLSETALLKKRAGLTYLHSSHI